MQCRKIQRNGYAWLEILLGIATLALLFQLFPSLWQAIDFRNWSRVTALVVNLLAIVFLIVLKASPNLIADFRERRQRSKAERLKMEKGQKRKEQREAVERMQESLKRRKF